MTESMLSVEELLLIQHLRDIPEGAARDELMALVGELVEFARDPRCARAQGDGVPCASAELACEECRHVAARLAELRTELNLSLYAR